MNILSLNLMMVELYNNVAKVGDAGVLLYLRRQGEYESGRPGTVPVMASMTSTEDRARQALVVLFHVLPSTQVRHPLFESRFPVH